MDDYRDQKLHSFRKQWYRGSGVGMLASLVETSDLTKEDVKKMKELLDEYMDE